MMFYGLLTNHCTHVRLTTIEGSSHDHVLITWWLWLIRSRDWSCDMVMWSLYTCCHVTIFGRKYTRPWHSQWVALLLFCDLLSKWCCCPSDAYCSGDSIVLNYYKYSRLWSLRPQTWLLVSYGTLNLRNCPSPLTHHSVQFPLKVFLISAKSLQGVTTCH